MNENKQSNIGTIVHAISAGAKGLASIAVAAGTAYAASKSKDLGLNWEMFAGSAALAYLIPTAIIDLSLAHTKYRNHKEGKTDFSSSTEDPSKINSSTYRLGEMGSYVVEIFSNKEF